MRYREEKIINWGLTDKDKKKWEWMKIGKQKLGAWI